VPLSGSVSQAARWAAWSAVAYVAITCVIGRHVLAAVGTAIASDPGDPILNAAILAWNAVHVPWTEAWSQFPIFYPTADALTLSEHLLGVSLIATPIYWITGNPLTAYNLTLLLSYPLSGLAMYALVWRLTGQPSPGYGGARAGAAFLAGLAFAFAPYRASQLPHIQVLIVFWAPLALLGLHGFINSAGPPSAEPAPYSRARDTWAGFRGGAGTTPRTRLRWLLLFAICWMLQGASNSYFLVYFSVVAGLWVLWFVIAKRRWRDAGLVAAATAVASLPLMPILYRYLVAQRELGLARNLGEIAAFGADIAAPLCAPPVLTFWGWLRVACGQEGELFAGTALLVLCLAGAIRASGAGGASGAVVLERRVLRVARRVAIAIAAVYIAIAISVLVIGPWRFDLGWVRASASSPDKPMSTALALLLIALVLSSWFRAVVRRGSTTTFYLGAAIVCWVLSWGPFPRLFGADALYQAPFAVLLQLPGVGGLRVPARFWMMTVMCLVIFMGLVVAQLVTRWSRRTAAIFLAAAACALAADGWMTIPTAAVPAAAADAAALKGATVLVLPLGDLAPDVAAVYHAVTGGWSSVNGYSGYEPGYYEALRTLSRAEDETLFEPFVERGDLHVVTPERQYRMPRRAAVQRRPPELGQRVGIAGLTASCSPEELAYASDGNLQTRWVCGIQTAEHQITIDLGQLTRAGAVVHTLGAVAADFPRQLLIETSPDGETWATAWQGSPAAAVLFATMDAPRITRVVLPFPPRAARYVRLRQVAELEVWTGTTNFAVLRSHLTTRYFSSTQRATTPSFQPIFLPSS
jgi:hypothetical protein